MTDLNQTIVDISGLAKVLCTSESTLLKNWRKYPHFFISDGRTARGARFNVQMVIESLTYYASMGPEIEKLQGQDQDIRPSSNSKNRIPIQRGRKTMGVERKALPQNFKTTARGQEYADLICAGR